MKPLHVIRHQPDAPLGVMSEVLDEASVPWRYVDPWRGEALPDASELLGLIVLGGEMNADAIERYPWLAGTRALMAGAVERELPVLGVCLGAQILTRALGGRVAAGGAREIGFQKVEVLPAGTRDPLLGVFAPSALVFQWHEDACDLPEGTELLARSTATQVQAFRAGPRAYGVQFHFEVTEREIAAWCDATPPDTLRRVWRTTKEGLLSEAQAHLPAQHEAGRRLASAFVDLLT